MKIKSLIASIVFSSLSLFSLNAFAVEPVSPNYDVALGQTVDLSQYTDEQKMQGPDGFYYIEFTPTQEVGSFKTYQMVVSPKSSKIFNISMYAPQKAVTTGGMSAGGCLKTKSDLMKVLESKYGEAETQMSTAKQDYITNTSHIKNNGKDIYISCASNNTMLQLIFEDVNVKAEAEKEVQ